MPLVIVEMWQGRSVAQKRRLARALTDAMLDHADARPDHLHVVIHDTPKDSWARAGVLGIDEPETPRKPREPGVLRYGHMLLMVEDMARTVAFYTERLGFTVRPAKPLQDGRPFTAFVQGIAVVEGRRPDHAQVDHIAFEVRDVRALRDRLAGAGVPFVQDLHDGPYGLTIYIRDPDGLKVELYQDGERADPADTRTPSATILT